jgi:hypothetical protein
MAGNTNVDYFGKFYGLKGNLIGRRLLGVIVFPSLVRIPC